MTRARLSLEEEGPPAEDDTSPVPTNCSVSKDDEDDVTVDVVEFRLNLNLSASDVITPLLDALATESTTVGKKRERV